MFPLQSDTKAVLSSMRVQSATNLCDGSPEKNDNFFAS